MWRGGASDTKYSPPHKLRGPLLCPCNSQVSDDVMYASTISHIHSSAPRYCLMPTLQKQSTWMQVITWECWWLGVKTLVGLVRARVRLAGAARPGRVKSPLVFLRPVLRSALLGDSSCGFHSTAPRPAQQHSAAAEEDDDDEDDDDDDEKMTILMNMIIW